MCYTILLVDDDSSLISSISAYLSDYGFQLKSASSVPKALNILNVFKPDLIISDIVMPAVNGYDFVKFIKQTKEHSHIPFILLTAKGMTKDRILGYDLGCHGYLVKPFDPEELVAMIKNVLNHKIKIAREGTGNIDSFPHKQFYQNDRKFTATEKNVLNLVMQGMTNKEISDELCFSTRNVEKYVSRLLSKTNTRNRTHLAQYCRGT
uniref:hypothetical protein n=1 Tax=Rhodochorton tenue TaxID=173034 RepID=UPI002A7F5BA6|nr:hypothetical protein UYM82_pgp158 [Rhodochorton tenue]WOK79417.1 hypothetical protein [Rhodochorton tenue]